MPAKIGRSLAFLITLSSCFWLPITPAHSQTPVFINEFHYDNASGDVGEAIEIAGPAGFDLTGWSIVAYNGSNGSTYGSQVDLDGTIPEVCNGFGVVVIEFSGLQNGPDGIALVDDSGNVVQFLSYEGSFTASGGPADGMTSTDIGFSESTSEPVGNSLQLSGSGSVAEDFAWGDPTPGTFGACNTGQTFNGTGPVTEPEINVERPAGSSIVDGGTDPQGDQTPGSQVSITYIIQNSGTTILNVNGITSTSAANVTVNDIIPTNLVVSANGGIESFTVTFTVIGAGPFSFQLQINNDDADEGNYSIMVSGSGIDSVSPQITATKTDLLLLDNDNDGEPDPGDKLKYTVEIANLGETDAQAVIFSDAPGAGSSLVAGSVTATQGAVISGNASGDQSLEAEVGTINSGAGIVIIAFEVTIKSPDAVEEIVSEVCNQGTVSGSNFADVTTDDPDTGTPGDATCTSLATGAITIIVDTRPDDAQDFLFAATGGLIPESFGLDDDSDGTLSNTQVFKDVIPGVYTITESDPSSTGFNLGNISFEQQGVVASRFDTGTRTATINIAPGDSVVAIFTNEQSGRPPVFRKSFSPHEIDLGGTSKLIFEIDNGFNGVAAVDLNFSDNLPNGVMIAGSESIENHCGGELSAVEGKSVISFNGGSLGAGTNCTIAVEVTSNTVGTFTNTSGDLTSSLGNSGQARATLNVRGLSLPNEFLFVADKMVETKKHSIIRGNIHSNNDIKLRKGKNSEIIGDLVAVDDVDIGRRNRVKGNIFAGDNVDNDGDVEGVVTERARVGWRSLPDVPAFETGRRDVEIKKKRWKSLEPGYYDKVEVSRKCTLVLRHDGNSGDYFFRKLEIEKRATLSIDVSRGPVTINISREIDFDENSEVLIKPGGDANSELVTFNYRDDGKVKIQEEARVAGTINAPRALVVLEERSRFKGAIFAERIEVESRVVALQHGVSGSLTKLALTDMQESEHGEPEAIVPTEYMLEQNYPNPFNPSTTIGFSLPVVSEVTIAIYNLRGQVVLTLISGMLGKGEHQIIWDGTDSSGMNVPSGLYLYRMRAGSFVATRKLILAR